jgi:uncharacterized protein
VVSTATHHTTMEPRDTGRPFPPRVIAHGLRTAIEEDTYRGEHVPLRTLVPHAEGPWRRTVSTHPLLRAVASRDEIAFRSVLGHDGAESPRLPHPVLSPAQLLATDDRERTALDWARMMRWDVATDLLERAMKKALVAKELEEDLESDVRDAVRLLQRNDELCQCMTDGLSGGGNSWVAQVQSLVEHAGISVSEVRLCVARIARVEDHVIESAISNAPSLIDPIGGLTVAIVRGFASHSYLEAESMFGWTVLSRAIEEDQLDLVDLLLKQGADPNHEQSAGKTPLGLACAAGNITFAKMLSRFGADAFQPAEGFHRRTPLMMAASSGFEAIVSWILSVAAEVAVRPRRAGGKPATDPFAVPDHWCTAFLELVEAQDQDGRTALDLAVDNRQLEAEKRLLEARSNAEERLSAWADSRVSLQWSSCPKCGERVRNEDMSRHMDRLCLERMIVTPRAGTKGLLVMVREKQEREALLRRPHVPSDERTAHHRPAAPTADLEQSTAMAHAETLSHAKGHEAFESLLQNSQALSLHDPVLLEGPFQASHPKDNGLAVKPLSNVRSQFRVPDRKFLETEREVIETVIFCTLGCGHSFRSEAEHGRHQTLRCPKRLVLCPLGCGDKMTAEESSSHCNSVCVKRNVVAALPPSSRVARNNDLCPFKCGARLTPHTYTRHCQIECSLRMVPCTQGCEASSLPISQMQDHILHDCPHSKFPCPLACEPDRRWLREELEHHVERECPFRTVACSWCEQSLQANQLPDHQGVCDCRPLPCTHGCGFETSAGANNRKELHSHETSDCDHRPVMCPQGCGVRIPLPGTREHVEQDCPWRFVECRFGCSIRVRQDAAGDHVKVCPLQPLRCELDALCCSRQLRSWFVRSGTKRRLLPCIMHQSTPLHAAARQGDVALADLLLSHSDQQECVDLPNGRGLTPLEVACWHNQSDMVKYLLSKGANASAPSDTGHFPLEHCLPRDSVECAELLLDAGADPTAGSSSPLQMAIRMNRSKLVQLFSSFVQRELFVIAMHGAIMVDDEAQLQRILLAASCDRMWDDPQLESNAKALRRGRYRSNTGWSSLRHPLWLSGLEFQAQATYDATGRQLARLCAAATCVKVWDHSPGLIPEFPGQMEALLLRRRRDATLVPTLTRGVSELLEQRSKRLEALRFARGAAFHSKVLHALTAMRHTALSFAAARGAARCIKVLLRAGAPVNVTHRVWDKGACVMQSWWRNRRAVRHLRTRQTSRGIEAIESTTRRLGRVLASHFGMRRALEEFHIVRKSERTPLFEAVFNGHVAIAAALVKEGASTWSRCYIVPDSPPPFMSQQPVLFEGTEGVLVRVPLLDRAGKISDEDLASRLAPIIIDSLAPPEVDVQFTRDMYSSKIRFSVPSFPLPEGMLVSHCISPRPLFLAEIAALGMDRLIRKGFNKSVGWGVRSQFADVVEWACLTTADRALRQFRRQRGHALDTRKRAQIEYQRQLEVEFESIVASRNGQDLVDCLARGLSADHECPATGHNPLSLAALSGDYVRVPAKKEFGEEGARPLGLVTDVVLEHFSTEPDALLGREAPLRATPLMVAAYQGNLHVVSALLAKGCDLQQQVGQRPAMTKWHQVGGHAILGIPESEVTGMTALHFAIYAARAEVVRELLMLGADKTLRTSELGLTATALANRLGHVGLGQVIEKFDTLRVEAFQVTLFGPSGLRLVPCEWGCGRRLLVGTQGHHDAECPRRLVQCPLQCDVVELFAADLDKHMKRECPNRLARCPHGCVQVILGSKLEAHLKECPRLTSEG